MWKQAWYVKMLTCMAGISAFNDTYLTISSIWKEVLWDYHSVSSLTCPTHTCPQIGRVGYLIGGFRRIWAGVTWCLQAVHILLGSFRILHLINWVLRMNCQRTHSWHTVWNWMGKPVLSQHLVLRSTLLPHSWTKTKISIALPQMELTF